MSVLGTESYAAVRHLVTDVKVLSREERNHILWYACDGGDLSMVKSVIKAGCDVDHFHRGHTPLMMASIRGHDEVVKELILAGCKVDLQSRKCSVGWLRFITMMASAWPVWVAWVVMALFMMVTKNKYVQMACYWLLLPTMPLHFFSKDSFKVSQVLRMKSWAKCMAWAGIVLAAVVVWIVLGATVSEVQLLLPATVLVVIATVTMLMAVTGVEVVRVKKEETAAELVTYVVVVALAGIAMWARGGTGAVATGGAVITAVLALTRADT